MGRIRSARPLELSRRFSVPFGRRPFGSFLAVALLVLGACAEDGSDPVSRPPCPEVIAIHASAPILQRLALERWGTLTEEERRAGFIGAEAISESEIVDLYPDIVETLEDDGYVFLG